MWNLIQFYYDHYYSLSFIQASVRKGFHNRQF
jgi:hypothetical protein